MLLGHAAYRATRRALARDQGRQVPSRLPLWRLLMGETAVLARRVGRFRFVGIIGVVFASMLLIQAVLPPSTPGPVLSSPWRWLVGALLSIVVVVIWDVVHALRRTRTKRSD